MPNNIIIPRDQFDQYMTREEFYKENLTSFPMIFPIKDLARIIACNIYSSLNKLKEAINDKKNLVEIDE